MSDAPHRIFLGGLPPRWEDVPARVVINMCGVWPRGEPYGRVCFAMPLVDAMDPEVVPSQLAVERFLAAIHLYASEHDTYWHCHAGINRSSFVLAAYLHLYRSLRISAAIAQLRERRSSLVLCNHEFEGALRGWYGGPDELEFERTPVREWLAVSRE